MALPNETLHTIFAQLPPSTLAVLACVSYRFNAVAERILYSSISITDFLSGSSPHPLRTLWWAESMRRRPHLIEAIKKLHIRWQADPSVPPPHYLLGACDRLAEVVRHLVFLESLDLFMGPANLISNFPHPPGYFEPQMHAVERVLRDCRFPQLRSCALGAEWTKNGQPYTTTLIAFLASLSNLRHLKLSDLHSPVVLPPSVLPLLTSFRGSADAAASILPGRPVHYLALIGQDSDLNRDNLRLMTYGSVPLRYIDLSAMSARPNILKLVSTYLPTVESLRVKLALRHTLHYSFSGIRMLTGLSSVLTAFPLLTNLDLSPTGVAGVGRGNSGEERSLCEEWFRACPTLNRVIFPSQSEWVLESDSNLWVQYPNSVPSA
ncbi:hypothetical protein CVT24_012829 [Panaeolus cyanescens]|uniref:F-box domain-containing protein n=1 Tax=Panaeolus cyanescens TaxID=181874 RepID=A0A409X4J9_9AGAR|nr:hypothetical protein CVT24_012829 [Panaeolus cyanescens]